jgi:hypothetical protein
MKQLDMNNGERYELAGLQSNWKSDEGSSGIADLQTRIRKEIASRRKFRRVRLFLVAFLWAAGLLLMGCYRQYWHENIGILAIGVALLVLAGWLGTASSGPDPLSAFPHQYSQLRASGKELQLKRTSAAQFIATLALAVSLWAIWFADRGIKHHGSMRELLPFGVLLIAVATIGGLMALRGSRRRELAYFRELERQFQLSDEQLADPTGDTEDGGHQPSGSKE